MSLKTLITRHKIDIIAVMTVLIACSALAIWYFKTPRSGGVADAKIYFERCLISDYNKEMESSPIDTDEARMNYGIMRIGDKINQIRIDMLSLLIAIDKSPTSSDTICVLSELGLTDNNAFISDIKHFGQPLGNLQTDSDSFHKTYPGPKGTKIKAWIEMPDEDNIWFVMDDMLGIFSDKSEPGTRELILEIKP